MKKTGDAFPDPKCILMSIHLSAGLRCLQVVNKFWNGTSLDNFVPCNNDKAIACVSLM